MPGVRIVTDSSCDLDANVVDKHNVRVVPLTIRFGAEEFTDREELSPQDFYRRMDGFDGLPETAAPAPGAFDVAFRELAADGADAVVCINISSALSATMASAENAARDLGEVIETRVVDSRSISAGLGTLVTMAAEAAAGGAGADEVVALVEKTRDRTTVLGGLDTLDNLKKGGRIGGAAAMIGTLISIKPVIDISSGSVEEAGKVRTRRKQMLFLRDKLVEAGDVERLVVCDGEAPDAEEFAELISEVHPRDSFTRSTIGPVIGVHGGPRVLGLTWLNPG